MRIRKGEKGDAAAITAMALKFYEQTQQYKILPPDPAAVRRIVDAALEGHGIVAVADDDGRVVGFTLIVTMPFMYNPALTAGCELGFWLDPEYRGSAAGHAMMEFVIKECEERGVDTLTMIALADKRPEAVGQLYERMGFTKVEISYIRTI